MSRDIWHQTQFWCYTKESHALGRSDSSGKSVVREELRGVFVVLQARSPGAKRAVFCETAQVMIISGARLSY